jgi:hypothetical protein
MYFAKQNNKAFTFCNSDEPFFYSVPVLHVRLVPILGGASFFH